MIPKRMLIQRKSAIPSDYVIHLQESKYNIRAKNGPKMFLQAISCKESDLWYNAMKDDMISMASNGV